MWAVFALDYYQIGQQIRKIRKAHGLSQEELAEKVGISTTHMSHIETGNTKLSLPVLIQIAEALEVQTDFLLNPVPIQNASTVAPEIAKILDRCTEREAQFILEIVKSAKRSVEKYWK